LEKTDTRRGRLPSVASPFNIKQMHARSVQHARVAPRTSTALGVEALLVRDCERGGSGLLIPRPEVQVVVRFGPAARGGVDVHAFGARQRVHRKLIQDGQRAVTARLPLGVPATVLGVPASTLAASVVALEDLWGDIATRRLCARLADAPDIGSAAAILASAIAERMAGSEARHAGTELALAADRRAATERALSLSEAELREAVVKAVAELPARDPKMAGRVIGAIKKQFGDRADAQLAKKIAEEELAKG